MNKSQEKKSSPQVIDTFDAEQWAGVYCEKLGLDGPDIYVYPGMTASLRRDRFEANVRESRRRLAVDPFEELTRNNPLLRDASTQTLLGRVLIGFLRALVRIAFRTPHKASEVQDDCL